MESSSNRYFAGVALLRAWRGGSQIVRRPWRIMAVMLLFAFGCPLAALAHVEKPKHGGQIVEVGDLHVELVLKSGQVTVFVSDHGRPIGLSGGSGRLIVVGKDGRKEVALSVNPQGDALEAKLPPTVKAGDKGVVVISLSGRKPIQARFVMN